MATQLTVSVIEQMNNKLVESQGYKVCPIK